MVLRSEDANNGGKFRVFDRDTRHAGKGGGAAALFYSLIESGKLAGVEPRAYLGEAARYAIHSLRGGDARARRQAAGIARTLTE